MSNPHGVVNILSSARHIVSEQDGQQRVEVKAFTGKGKLLELRQLVQQVDRMEQDMAELVELTKQVDGRMMVLMIHRRYATGQVTLRWREYGAGRRRHLSWLEAQDAVKNRPEAVRQWYQKVTNKALQLNDLHIQYRGAIKATRIVLGQSEQKVFAKAISG